MTAAPLTLADFDFALPAELIAQHPAVERSASRLLDGRGAPPIDQVFRNLPALLRAGDLLVVNDTRVIKARLHGRKASGGSVEALVERIEADGTVLAHLRASKSPKAGSKVRFADAFGAEVIGRAGADDSLFALRFESEPHALLEAHGHVPLPPYIARPEGGSDAARIAEEDDARRYQTVFAAHPGAVAAPTAALHFDAGVLAALTEHGIGTASVTLHVGAGTFQPVRSENIAEHVMHRERYAVPLETAAAIERTRAAGGRIVAVGTTSLRALESEALRVAEGAGLQATSGDTGIFITPGFRFRVVDVLLTNFHLPKSTLMMLVSAFAGHAHVMALYRHAIAERYRFFSYGDAMLLERVAGSRPAATCASTVGS